MDEPTERKTESGPAQSLSAKPEELKEQAKWIRQWAREDDSDFQRLYAQPLAEWKKVVYLLSAVLIVSLAAWLLIAAQTRRELIGALGGQVAQLYRADEGEIFRLPPPPPRPVRPRIEIQQGTLSTAEQGSSQEAPGILFLDQQPPSAGGREESGPARPVAPPKGSGNQEAYRFLVENSDTARKLFSSEFEEFEFQDWKPVKNDPPVFFIDLVAKRRSDGQELHAIWSVNVESGQITPLSQAARDLQAR